MARKKRKITITRSQWKKESLKQADAVTNICMLCIIWHLHNTEGFGKKRLSRVCEGIVEIAEDIAEGRLTPDDIRNTIAEETGFEMK